MLDLLAGLPIYFETSFSLGQCPPDLLQQLLDRHPPEYLLFGSDAPWADQAEELAKFLDLDLPEEARRAALWDNVHRFVGLPPGE